MPKLVLHATLRTAQRPRCAAAAPLAAREPIRDSEWAVGTSVLLEILGVDVISARIVLETEIPGALGTVSHLFFRDNPTLIFHRSRLIKPPLVTKLWVVGYKFRLHPAFLTNTES
jgi:hypothetical protein